jgi:hypothetical protein
MVVVGDGFYMQIIFQRNTYLRVGIIVRYRLNDLKVIDAVNGLTIGYGMPTLIISIDQMKY